ncbi:MAG: bifunctional aldolase/short-chain dehydrogenase [Deltaproteobacteria bacterium]|nr:MAG: bifunctional aldolase/short-chain dehydrogenase [Deltaproteobacteria bacterium]
MKRWSNRELQKYKDRYAKKFGEALAVRVYTSQLLGKDPDLVLHGGGNTSVKAPFTTLLGDKVPALYVKGSGWNMATAGPEGFVPLDLETLLRLRKLDELGDDAMFEQLRVAMLRPLSFNPSIEALAHAWIGKAYVDHTHANAILTLTNQDNGEERVREALGDDVLIRPYIHPGFYLSKDIADSLDASPNVRGIVLMHHGLFTFDDDPRVSYETHLELVDKAESYIQGKISRTFFVIDSEGSDNTLVAKVAPIVRGALAGRTRDPDHPFSPVILRILRDEETLGLISHPDFRKIIEGPVLTADFLIRTKPWMAWVESPSLDDLEAFSRQIHETVHDFSQRYQAYYKRGVERTGRGFPMFNPSPRILVIPGLGVFCTGSTLKEANITADLAKATLRVKRDIIAMGGNYLGIPEEKLFEMEYWGPQLAKLSGEALPLAGRIAVITGAAGAIGSAICRKLCEEGCIVVGTDLEGERLEDLEARLTGEFGENFFALPMDVTDEASVRKGFEAICLKYGGVDILISNAGIAFVKALDELDLEDFRRIEKVNVEGTLLFLKWGIKILKAQATGGDVVHISTKNVPSPGSSFGAYSATKAAAHQLARVASLELAPHGIRVNNLAPDAVFKGEGRKSGLWEVCGPERMKARGLDEQGLEEYYRNRNLLKIQVRADHVANGVFFFVSRQTPTTGATLPIDGGLPDATPR